MLLLQDMKMFLNCFAGCVKLISLFPQLKPLPSSQEERYFLEYVSCFLCYFLIMLKSSVILVEEAIVCLVP